MEEEIENQMSWDYWKKINYNNILHTQNNEFIVVYI